MPRKSKPETPTTEVPEKNPAAKSKRATASPAEATVPPSPPPAKSVKKTPKKAEKKGKKSAKRSNKPVQKKPISESAALKAKKAHQQAFLTAINAQVYPNISKACKTAGIGRVTFYDWRDNDPAFQQALHELEERVKDQYEENLYKDSKAGDSKSTVFFLERKGRDRGYGKEADSSKMRAILKRAMEGEITPLDAAYEINMLGLPLPEVLKLQLNKPAPPPPPPEERPPLTSEELEQKYQESLKIAEGQREDFLPKRQEEIRELKEEMKNLEQFGEEGGPAGVEA